MNNFQSIFFTGITIEDTSGQVNIYQADEEATFNTENYEHISHSETASLSSELELQDTDLVCPAGTASCVIDFNYFTDSYIYLQAPDMNDDDYGTNQARKANRKAANVRRHLFSLRGVDSDKGFFLTRKTRGDLGVEVELDTADDEAVDVAENDDDDEVTYSVSYYGHVNWTFAILLAYIIIPGVLVGAPFLLIYMCIYCTTKREAHLRLLDTPPVSTSAHIIVTRPEIKATTAVTGYSTIEETPLLHGEDHYDDGNTYPTATIHAVPYQASPVYGDGDTPYPMYINPNNRAPAFGDPDEPYISQGVPAQASASLR